MGIGVSSPTVRYLLLTRPECHLCTEMEHLLSEVLPSFGEGFVMANVDSDPEWRRRYGEVIPVLLRDGKAVAKIRLKRAQLEKIVRRSRGFREGHLRDQR